MTRNSFSTITWAFLTLAFLTVSGCNNEPAFEVESYVEGTLSIRAEVDSGAKAILEVAILEIVDRVGGVKLIGMMISFLQVGPIQLKKAKRLIQLKGRDKKRRVEI